jgi:hypothetical protein
METVMTARKITIKPVGGANYNEHDVFANGERVARFMFSRRTEFYYEGNIRKSKILTASWVQDFEEDVRYQTGYCWFKDITRDIRAVYSAGKTFGSMY